MTTTFLKPYLRSFSGDTETPITLFYKFVGVEKGFLLESRGKGEFSFLGKSPKARLYENGNLFIETNNGITETTGKILDQVRDYLMQYQTINSTKVPFVGGAVGVIAYDMIREIEKLPDDNPDVLKMPNLDLFVVTELIAYDHLHDRIFLIVLQEDTEDGRKEAELKLDQMEAEMKRQIPPELYQEMPLKPVTVTSSTTKEQYMDMVKKAKRYIYEGDIFQVVLSQRLKAHTEESPLILYRKLRAMNPSPYLYYFNFGSYQVAGSSPEMLVEVRKEKVFTCPIAGTRKRGRDLEEDTELMMSLKNDPKERAEHIMLLDLARNDMGRIAQIGSVEITKFMNVQNYSHVMHMVSLVEGQRKKTEDAFSILKSFLPAGTLSGAPKIRAMEIIEELESEKRGVYGGAVGYFSFDGDMDFCIAIRTMILKNGNVFIQSGAGIVADSHPELEYEECHNKARALVETIGGEI